MSHSARLPGNWATRCKSRTVEGMVRPRHFTFLNDSWSNWQDARLWTGTMEVRIFRCRRDDQRILAPVPLGGRAHRLASRTASCNPHRQHFAPLAQRQRRRRAGEVVFKSFLLKAMRKGMAAQQAGVAQWQEALSSKGRQSGFDSLDRYWAARYTGRPYKHHLSITHLASPVGPGFCRCSSTVRAHAW